MENKAKFCQSEKNISRDDILEFEQKVNIILPEIDKNLILIHNGGQNENDNMILDCLFSIKYGECTLEDSIHSLQIVEENIPSNYLPFAYTGTGNTITLNLELGNDYGKIYLFRYDKLEPRFLKDSLEELLGVESIDEI